MKNTEAPSCLLYRLCCLWPVCFFPYLFCGPTASFCLVVVDALFFKNESREKYNWAKKKKKVMDARWWGLMNCSWLVHRVVWGYGGVIITSIGAAITADYRGNSRACEILSLLLDEMVSFSSLTLFAVCGHFYIGVGQMNCVLGLSFSEGCTTQILC